MRAKRRNDGMLGPFQQAVYEWVQSQPAARQGQIAIGLFGGLGTAGAVAAVVKGSTYGLGQGMAYGGAGLVVGIALAVVDRRNALRAERSSRGRAALNRQKQAIIAVGTVLAFVSYPFLRYLPRAAAVIVYSTFAAIMLAYAVFFLRAEIARRGKATPEV